MVIWAYQYRNLSDFYVMVAFSVVECPLTLFYVYEFFMFFSRWDADPTSITKRAGDNSLIATTSISYDVFGNVVSEDGPKSGDGDKVIHFYDLGQRRIGSISGDPDGNDSLKRKAVRTIYDNMGRASRVETGVASGETLNDLNSMAVIGKQETTYDLIGRKILSKITTFTPANPSGKIMSLVQTTYDSANQVTCAAERLVRTRI
ncbi:hypothetical protein [Asticcacaulis endophyticus]|uniref:YD repeat-containing protein n=1 Tax=Asticcacaulis endophyticus TaxID=1395890 RepID=A0A918Q1L7_9CAUL|nr:hypothetical protein [Asticcacaulis endophyticus]GGZ30452.1 hypothetical protein GCM10011273_15910 [Asticcacaulis endophyticus]